MKLLRQLLHNKKALAGVTILAIVILVAIFAPLLTEYSPTQRVGRPHQPPSADHLLGTTRLGYDVFTRLIYGARVSLAVGFGAGLLITVIGTVLGFTSWAWGVRVTRSETMSIRQRDFVKSAEMLGEPGWRIMTSEIFPNLISIVGINFIGSVLFAIITQATLEFLGLGDP